MRGRSALGAVVVDTDSESDLSQASARTVEVTPPPVMVSDSSFCDSAHSFSPPDFNIPAPAEPSEEALTSQESEGIAESSHAGDKRARSSSSALQQLMEREDLEALAEKEMRTPAKMSDADLARTLFLRKKNKKLRCVLCPVASLRMGQ